MENPWNSLELVKVIVSVITPIVGGIIAWKLAQLGKNVEKKQWTDRKIVEKRLEFYDKIVPKLNDLYCYFYRVGNWKEITPLNIVLHKRELDREFNIYAHIFKEEDSLLKKYNKFIKNCFKTHTGWGNDAKIKMNLSKRINLPNWKTEWNELFVPDEQIEEDKFKDSYNQLIYVIRRELEL